MHYLVCVMETTTYLIIIVSVSMILQLMTAVMALWLTRYTGRRYSWLLIALALILMTARRVAPLIELLRGDGSELHFSFEVTGMVLSSCMLAGMVGVRRIFKEKRSAEEENRLLLAEKETLLRETNHRIKNNMNTMAILLEMQADKMEPGTGKSALEEAAGRTESMMVLYDQLYHAEHTGQVSLAEYIPDMLDRILGIFPQASDIINSTDVEDIEVDARTASVLGILVNELVTNSVKYAFPDRLTGGSPAIRVSVNRTDDMLVLEYSDNGIGINPANIRTEGFGLQLVDTLVDQLKGTLSVASGNGLCYRLSFPAR